MGWKLFPNLEWTWAGSHWYARDFSVRVSSNSHGFRDLPRSFQKPPQTIRVALLGDSFVEAMQVPFEETAGSQLEQRLNASTKHCDVLNFGISSHSLGQSLLVWEEYASKFSPDFVFVFVGLRSLERTVDPYEKGAFPKTRERALSVRPVFQLKNGQLVLEPARDFHLFVKTQQEVLQTEFKGARRIKKRHGLFLRSVISTLGQVPHSLKRQFFSSGKKESAYAKLSRLGVEDSTFRVNLRVIERLGQEVKKGGGQLVILDAVQYTTDRPLKISQSLKRFSLEKKLGYIPLSDNLLDAEREGAPTHWRHDGHFNWRGNKIAAEAMYRWLSVRTRNLS